MLRHYVFFDILAVDDNVEHIKKSLYELSKKMNGCVDFQFGKCTNTTYHSFFVDFVDESSRDAYLTHPEHVKIASEIIIPKLKNGLKSVIVFDYLKSEKPEISKMKEGLIGYILVKIGDETEVLKKLQKYCDKINRFTPLQNRSIEELGKEYPYMLKVEALPGKSFGTLDRYPTFWWAPIEKSPNPDSGAFIKSKL